MSSSSVAVVGGGLGGLSSAISLAVHGFDVTLFEASEEVGGKAGSLELGGYRFDKGPSLLTMLHVFENLFLRANRDMEDYIETVPLSPLTCYWFSDGTNFSSDRIDVFKTTLTQYLDVRQQEISSFEAYSRRIYDLTHKVFLERSIHHLGSFLHADTLKSLLRIGQVDLFRSMHTANSSFFSDPRMIQLLDRYATYNGSDPYRAPAVLNNIFHVEHGLGGYGVKNGIFGIPLGMKRLAEDLGVDIRTGEKVERIIYDSKRSIRGVETERGSYDFPWALSDVDVLTLYRDLLGDEQAPLAKRYAKLPPSSSALVFYWGIHSSFDQLGVHNIFFSPDYRREFSQIHDHAHLPDEPTIYVNITSKITPDDAPEGCENWFVLVNAPFHDGRSWDGDALKVRGYVLERLSGVLGCDIESLIDAESILSPADIEKETGSYRGSLYGISSNTRTAAFLRHRNDSHRYRGLYLCGGSVHPGGGMPLSVQSGMIAADLLYTDSRRR
jgi:phytoene desaturase